MTGAIVLRREVNAGVAQRGEGVLCGGAVQVRVDHVGGVLAEPGLVLGAIGASRPNFSLRFFGLRRFTATGMSFQTGAARRSS
jgi:hypothetical protein